MFDDLIERGLVRVKEEGNFLTYKYDRKVFYNNLWNDDTRLLDARGMVVDKSTQATVIWPFTKIFNRFENGVDLPIDQEVVSVRKVNGFMASARWYGNELVVATTGTTGSDFAKMARGVLEDKIVRPDALWASVQRWTLLFEIVHVDDPHIVHETPGAYLIGMRHMASGEMEDESFLDWIAQRMNFMRPEWKYCQFGEVVAETKECKHEGFVVRSKETRELLLKIKSPYYLTKKFLARMGQAKTTLMWENTEAFKQTIDEEFYPLVDFIVSKISSPDDFYGLTEHSRKAFVDYALQHLEG